MKRWIIAPILALALPGCHGLPQYSAPAPAGAVSCAVAEAQRLGYQRMEGSRTSGVVRLGRNNPAPTPQSGGVVQQATQIAREGPVVQGPPFQNQIRVSERGGRLRIAVLSPSTPPAQGETLDVTGDAQQILARCSTT